MCEKETAMSLHQVSLVNRDPTDQKTLHITSSHTLASNEGQTLSARLTHSPCNVCV
jgi:hypothetical protein